MKLFLRTAIFQATNLLHQIATNINGKNGYHAIKKKHKNVYSYGEIRYYFKGTGLLQGNQIIYNNNGYYYCI